MPEFKCWPDMGDGPSDADTPVRLSAASALLAAEWAAEHDDVGDRWPDDWGVEVLTENEETGERSSWLVRIKTVRSYTGRRKR